MNRTNKKSMRIICSILLAAFMLGLFSTAVIAEQSGVVTTLTNPEIESPYAVIRNMNTGQIVYDKAADTKISPASTVKLMVALVAYEKLPDKSKIVAASKAAVSNIAGNNINIREGEEFKVNDLLAAVLISCANDACNVIAEAAAGSVADFVKLMNKKAAELGMADTNYTNTTGFDDTAMHTTAADTAKLAEAVYKVNDLATLADTPKFIIASTNKSTNQRNLLSKNHLVSTFVTAKYSYDPAIGLNAGFTDNGGHCVVTASDKDNLAFIYVLMGWQGESKSATEDNIKSYSEAKTLIDWTQRTFELKTVKATAEMLGEIKVNLGNNTDNVVVRPAKDIEVIFDKRLTNIITYKPSIDLDDESLMLEAPVEANRVIGTVDVLLNGKVVTTMDLVTMSSVSRDEFSHIMAKIGAFFKSKTLVTIIIVLVSLIAVYILLSITLKIIDLVRKIKRRQEKKNQAIERRKNANINEDNRYQTRANKKYIDDDDEDDDDED